MHWKNNENNRMAFFNNVKSHEYGQFYHFPQRGEGMGKVRLFGNGERKYTSHSSYKAQENGI